MQHEKWSCPNCNEKNYELGEIRVTGSFWSKIFNIQEKDINFDSIKNHNQLIINKKINKIDILFKKIDNKND